MVLNGAGCQIAAVGFSIGRRRGILGTELFPPLQEREGRGGRFVLRLSFRACKVDNFLFFIFIHLLDEHRGFYSKN